MAENARNELSERKKRILKAIVDAHIVDGEPVGSKYIMQDEHLNCSSATIRNEMAELEALGYLEQPHTSAGRVPSELGYRFYVDTLIESYAMTTTEIAEINKLQIKNERARSDPDGGIKARGQPHKLYKLCDQAQGKLGQNQAL